MKSTLRSATVGLASVAVALGAARAQHHAILVEAEAFADHGGWQLDTQFIETMGSPYLLAHGLGVPVADAVTSVRVAHAGRYTVWVRTLDWVARWGAPGTPGRFSVWIDGAAMPAELGVEGAAWGWHRAGDVALDAGPIELRLRDATGFDGRCDALLLTTDPDAAPPDDATVLPAWRRRLLGLPDVPAAMGPYDLVVVGGGYAGTAAAISAARMGCRVALIQNRGVLGGNGSSEVRVWAKGETRRGRFPRLGEIVASFEDRAKHSPGTREEFVDDLKERVVRAEPNLALFLHHHAYQVETAGGRITAVTAFDTRSGARRRFAAPLFCDATGHGTVGALAGADWDMTPEGRMGMSNMWRWAAADAPRDFPSTPWALQLGLDDFPYPHAGKGEWFWESGFDVDPLTQAEAVRDWNLRAVFGAFQAMKSGPRRDEHRAAALTWVAYIGGTRESRRLLGDVILTQDDIVEKREFPDGCVPSTWSIDLHYPKEQYLGSYPDNPFISRAHHDHRVDRSVGYPIPYRCFYSRNVTNLFVAGRCISVTHEALGTVRVMKTCGMMGEVVGKAASICIAQRCLPGDVFPAHWPALVELMQLPGVARRASVGDPIEVPADAPRIHSAAGRPATGTDPATMVGLVVDDADAELRGPWTHSANLAHVGWGYRYAAPDSGAVARFPIAVQRNGRYEVRFYTAPHANRGTAVAVRIESAAGVNTVVADLRREPTDAPYLVLGTYGFRLDRTGAVEVSAAGAGGIVHADAIQLVPAR